MAGFLNGLGDKLRFFNNCRSFRVHCDVGLFFRSWQTLIVGTNRA